MFSRKPLYRNGLDDLLKAKEESSKLRSLATRKLLRTLEEMKAEQNEKELGRVVQYGRNSGAL